MPSNTPNLNLYKKNPQTDGEDTFNIETMLNENFDKIDAEFSGTTGHKHTGAAGDAPKIGSDGLAAGAANDAAIGDRTISDTTAPTGNVGKLGSLLSWIANRIKAITGKAKWSDAPAMTLEEAKTHVDASAGGVHGSTSAATANKLMHRDAAGRAKVAAPVAADDIARKYEVDAVGAVASGVAGKVDQDVRTTASPKFQKVTAGASGMAVNLPTDAGAGSSWARGYELWNAAGATRLGGFGALGGDAAVGLIYLGHGSSPWSDGNGIYIKTNGYVGIKTTNPTNELDVNGWVKAARFISDVATGIAPFQVASTTMVNNLNPQYLQGMLPSSATANNSIVARNSTGQSAFSFIYLNNPTGTAPFSVSPGSTKVDDLIADMLDGLHASDFARTMKSDTVLDLNNITTPGMHRLGSSHTHAPGTVYGYANMLVVRGGADTIAQIIFPYATNDIVWRRGNPTEVGGAGTYSNWMKIWNEGNDGAGSGLDADLLDGKHAIDFITNTATTQFGGNQNSITTAQFLDLLNTKGAFAQTYWVTRGSWEYSMNQVITDTGVGDIQLAGSTVEVIGKSKDGCTIRIHTASTTSLGLANAEFVYVSNGAAYEPGWRRVFNSASSMQFDVRTAEKTLQWLYAANKAFGIAANKDALSLWDWGNNRAILQYKHATAQLFTKAHEIWTGAGIEMDGAYAGTSYIDFHNVANNADFDARIISTGGNATNVLGGGQLAIQAKSFVVDGKTFIGRAVGLGTDATITMAIGDDDTGINWISDGKLQLRANNAAVADIESSGISVAATTSYGARVVRNTIISTAAPSGGQDGDIWVQYV